MVQTLIKNWWLFALRGILAVVFSAAVFLMHNSVQSLTLREFATKGLIVFLGMLAIAAGACTIMSGIWSSGHGKWWLLVLDGLAISAAGLILILSNSITLSIVAYLLVLLAIVIGLVELASARMLRRHVPDEWFLGVAGGASIAFAVTFLWIKPEEAASAFVWLGYYSGFSAICMLALAFRLRSLRRAIHRIARSALHSG